MDENSCEKEITENVDDQKERKTKDDPQTNNFGVLALTGKASRHQGPSRFGCSVDNSVSGPSTNLYAVVGNDDRDEAGPALADRQPQQATQTHAEPSAQTQESEETPRESETLSPSTYNICEPRVRASPQAQEQPPPKRGSVGPPPSYSFVMKQKKRMKRVPSPDILVANRPPPPNYSGTRGLYLTSEERPFGFREFFHPFLSFAEPIWRSHSQPALCPRCGIIVLTTAHAHESIATHVAALALCLFGCWPCCLLPYCMNACKNTYHYCPICQTFLGLYTPW